VPADFYCTINKTTPSEEDYSSFSSWESALDEADVSDTQCRVYDVASVTGTVSDQANVTGQTNSYIAKVLHVNNANTSPRRVMVVHDTFGEEFVASEQLQVDGSNYITLANPAGSDTVRPVAQLYKGGGDLDDQVTVAFAGQSVTNFVTLTSPEGERHTGVAGTGAVIDPSSGGPVIDCNTPFTVIEWLEVKDFTQSWTFAVDCDGATSSIIRNNIVHDSSGTDYTGGILLGSENSVLNNTVYNVNYEGIRANFENAPICRNNTVYNFSRQGNYSGIVLVNISGVGYITNCVVLDTDGTGACLAWDTGNVTEAYNAVSDSSATHVDSLTSQDSDDYFVDKTGGSEDLRLKTGAPCIDEGTDLGTPDGVNIDITGRDRDAEGDVWDMGSHEFVSVAAAYIPKVIMVS
jgi:hypothetical protein